MKKVLLTASIASALSLFNVAHANSGTINFDGEIVDATCEVKVSDGAADVTTVALPGVAKSAFSGPNATAGRTMFTLVASNCQDFTTGSNKVAAFFNPDSTNVESSTGLLNNIATASPATGVQLELLDGGTNSPIKAGYANQATTATFVEITGTSPTGTATIPYFVQYKSVTGTVTPGDVKGAVTFDLMYK